MYNVARQHAPVRTAIEGMKGFLDSECSSRDSSWLRKDHVVLFPGKVSISQTVTPVSQTVDSGVSNRLWV